MYISKLVLKDVRGFSNLSFDLKRPDGSHAGWTVFTGDNGSGKSTLLKAIAIALTGKDTARALQPSFHRWIREGQHEASIELEVVRTAVPARIAIDERAVVTVRVRNGEATASPVVMAEESIDYALGDRPRFVLPSLRPGESQEVQYTVRSHSRGGHRIGPLGIRIEPWGKTGVDEAREYFREQAAALLEGGVDLFILETFRDLNEIGAAIDAVRSLSDLPIVAQMTTEEDGNTLDGTPPERFAPELERRGATRTTTDALHRAHGGLL